MPAGTAGKPVRSITVAATAAAGGAACGRNMPAGRGTWGIGRRRAGFGDRGIAGHLGVDVGEGLQPASTEIPQLTDVSHCNVHNPEEPASALFGGNPVLRPAR
jgi:hypothetical protein